MNTRPDYDVALSFAGEDRPYVDAVAKALMSANVRVFYDRYEIVDLWGKDLYKHLSAVFSSRARYCVTFISKWYASKLWPRHELDSALVRAVQENREYILPARFDETEMPGIDPNTAYIDLRAMAPEELAALIIEKVGAEPEDPAPKFDREELHAFLRDNRLVRQLDEQIASFAATGRLDGVLDHAMAGLRVLGIRTLDELEVALGTHRKLILQWAAHGLRGVAGPTRHGISLLYLAYARLSEWRDTERLVRYLQVCHLTHGGDPHAAATRIIDTYLQLTR